MTTVFITDADRAPIAAVASSEAPPGTIVHDFDALLDYLGKDGIPVSPKTSEFAIARLPELNGLLTHPAPVGLSRGRQVSYPHVDGLHLLLRFSRLGKFDRSNTTVRMVLSTEMAAKWQLLNPTERYFSLLERWWSFADFAQKRFGFTSSLAEYRLELLKRHRPGSRARKADNRWQEAIFGLLGLKQVALMQLFGLLDIVSEPPVAGKGWQIKRMVATPWGLIACATYLQAFRHTSAGLIERLFNLAGEDSIATEEPSVDEMDRPPFFSWADAVIPFFPAWQRSLGEPEAAELFRGSVTFKVSLSPDVLRRIVMPAESSFDALARFILNAFKFDDEHLYQFRYQDEYAAERSLDDPRCSDVEDDYADEVTLGEAGLFPRQVVEFRYDFGDEWRFDVLVEKLDTSETGAKPAVVDRAGKAPRQYQ